MNSHPKGREDQPHIEVHLSITMDDEGKAEEKLRRAVMQSAGLVGEVGGEIIVCGD